MESEHVHVYMSLTYRIVSNIERLLESHQGSVILYHTYLQQSTADMLNAFYIYTQL